MEDRDDEVKINVDKFSDSYARDVNTDELMEVSILLNLNEAHHQY